MFQSLTDSFLHSVVPRASPPQPKDFGEPWQVERVKESQRAPIPEAEVEFSAPAGRPLLKAGKHLKGPTVVRNAGEGGKGVAGRGERYGEGEKGGEGRGNSGSGSASQRLVWVRA